MAKKQVNHVHVVRRDKSWAVVNTLTGQDIGGLPTQQSGINIARPMAQAQEGDLFIHGRNNRIREGRSYGNDPNPPKDKA
ncbi:MAG: DUF2188 domain-containing protein [Anaerolineales bacterium]|nr:DUF2188 domain-containing protein [Anaerolineales bacterium]